MTKHDSRNECKGKCHELQEHVGGTYMLTHGEESRAVVPEREGHEASFLQMMGIVYILFVPGGSEDVYSCHISNYIYMGAVYCI